MKCNQLLSIHIIHNFKIILLPSSYPPRSILYFTAALHLNPIYFTHLVPKQLSIFTHILNHFLFKICLFTYFVPLIYTLFNLSLLFFINFHSCNLILSSQDIRPCFLIFFQKQPMSHHSTTHFFGGFPPSLLSHTPLLHCQPLTVSPAPNSLNIDVSIPLLLSNSQDI